MVTHKKISGTGGELFDFFSSLKIRTRIENGVEILNPFTDNETLQINQQFYDKYYSDTDRRTLILGINPGRFGAGITGISFTDPVILENKLGLSNSFDKKPELSATFIHAMIDKYGGYNKFFKNFILSAVSPLGFVRNNINLNYYDIPSLQQTLTPFITQSLKKQIAIAKNNDVMICIGMGKNLEFMNKLNRKEKLFKEIIPLPHPRWILQYKRKQTEKYIDTYLNVLNKLT